LSKHTKRTQLSMAAAKSKAGLLHQVDSENSQLNSSEQQDDVFSKYNQTEIIVAQPKEKGKKNSFLSRLFLRS